MASLTQDSKGNFKARKRIPRDVQDDYGRLYGPRLEAKFFALSGLTKQEATRRYGEWLAEVETRISSIRAQRNGQGASLTRMRTRALAGEWYDWFIERHPLGDIQVWTDLKDKVQSAFQLAISEKEWDESDPDELFQEREDVRQALRPVLADVAETAQFLANKGMALDNDTRNQFLDFLYDDLAATLDHLIRIKKGDLRPDTYRERFPKFEDADSGDTPWQLFQKWVPQREPAVATEETWRYVFRTMTQHFKDRSAGSITPDEAQQWINSLKNPKRSARTVDKNWITASKTVFGWAFEQKLIQRNPFENVTVTVPKQIKLRETQAFRSQEWRTILKASLEIPDTDSPDNAARRWVPWLCAYTGARVGEITQLRKQDVFEQDGVAALLITPDAGTVKNRRARMVPLHQDLIDQGFLAFVSQHAAGPLFYRSGTPDGTTKRKKPRAVQARQRLAAWVRGLGIADPELQPNHAWRHTFKQIADHAEITERMSNYITGHAHKNEGAKYGAPTLKQMADAMKKFPTYTLD